MNKTLATVVLSLTTGCSDYTLSQQKRVASGPTEDTLDAGFYGDTGSSEHIETYNTCDPYGEAWQLNPEGTERNGCYAIEGYAQANEDNDTLETQIYYGDCDIIGYTETPTVIYRASSGDDIGQSMSNQTNCDGAFYLLGFTDKFSESGELSNLYVEDRIWFLSSDEDASSPSTEELYAMHDPLIYVLSCNEGAESIVEDCIAFMYK